MKATRSQSTKSESKRKQGKKFFLHQICKKTPFFHQTDVFRPISLPPRKKNPKQISVSFAGNASEMIPSINFRSLSLCLEFESDENLDEDFVEKIFDAVILIEIKQEPVTKGLDCITASWVRIPLRSIV